MVLLSSVTQGRSVFSTCICTQTLLNILRSYRRGLPVGLKKIRVCSPNPQSFWGYPYSKNFILLIGSAIWNPHEVGGVLPHVG